MRIPVGRGFAGRIAQERRAHAIADMDGADGAVVLNPLLRTHGIRSLLGVPLMAGDELLGVLHVGTRHRRTFDAGDADRLQALADRVALTLRARTSRDERAAAAALQRSLWPAALPAVPGIELAARYVPGGYGQMGGDWYDVLTSPGGATWVVIGDVVGRGLAAAMAMGRLRGALRAYATDLSDPAALLTRLDRYLARCDPTVMATVLCGVVDAGCTRLRLSSAGHPPPVVATGAGVAADVHEVLADLPLGVGAGLTRRSTSIALGPGTTVCLYTDGLVERRGVSIDDGIDRLARTVTADAAESVCAAVMSALVGDATLDDDIAVLVLRRQGTRDGPEPLERHLPAVPSSIQPLRAALQRWLDDAGASRAETIDVLLAVGEAVANVVEHAYGPRGGLVHLHVTREGTDVVATVRDTGRWRSPRGRFRGRGLTMLEAAADEVDVQRSDSGTRVLVRKTLEEWAR